jgi:two-component system CheB/CheR fusion protein
VSSDFSGPQKDLFVVAVGASAGGVPALSHLFQSVPKDINAAFLVVTHLGPHRESHLSEVLGRSSDLPVQDAVDGEALQRGVVYVLPANAILTLEDHRLVLRSVTVDQRERNPIDICFASLARTYRENSIGVILSGAGHDGTLGAKVIKEEGGLTIAQSRDQDGPEHDSMPNSAIRSGYIDLQVPLDRIAATLDEYVRSTGSLGAMVAASQDRDVSEVREDHQGALKQIYEVLRSRVGHDFEGYKEKTFLRRVQRRMHVTQQRSFADYSEFLERDTGEPSALFGDLLIGVTTFFRDTDSFQAVGTQVIPRLFEHASSQDTLRVWVPGCATGEEAYSLAILLREHMEGRADVPKVQVFATDIDDSALSAARAGRYPAALLEGMDPARLARFFRSEPGSYVVSKELRDLCIFSSHSVIRDPPFSRMDFVSCRNLLIYFTADLQNNVLPIIHYALKPNGFLFLGPSENISRHADLFATVDRRHRIFQKRATSVGPSRFPIRTGGLVGVQKARDGHTGATGKDQQIRRLIEDRVLENHAPAHIVVDAEGDILFYSARTGKYLEPQVGTPSRQLVAMARRGLRLDLRAALREAVERRMPVVRERIEVDIDDRVQSVRLTIEPLPVSGSQPLFLVVFADLGPPVSREDIPLTRLAPARDDVSQLEAELKETRDRLQATIEEYETALEELKSGNEELVSVNEELQSTNEELQTSKEELQSVNEELHTVNAELTDRVEDLHRANSDMHNLLESTQIGTVFLDRNMIIRSYTPSVTGIFNLIKSDRGRPITDVSHNLEQLDLRTDILHVLDTSEPLERTVTLRNKHTHYLMRVLPYRTADAHVDGAWITLVDVTAMTAAEEKQRLLVAELNHRVRNMLQVVMGLASQSIHKSQDLEQFGKAFFGRMQALARAYELLSRDGWHKVPVADLLQSQLSAFATESSRYSISGENLVLTSNAALALGLVLYELSTNATKYGALSVPSGHVAVSWSIENLANERTNFIMSWRESGGPAVKHPTRQGFGTELVQRQLKYELNGTAVLDYLEDGLVVTLSIPAAEALDSKKLELNQ